MSRKETKQRKYSRISLYLTTKRKGWLSELRRCLCSVLSFGRRSDLWRRTGELSVEVSVLLSFN